MNLIGNIKNIVQGKPVVRRSNKWGKVRKEHLKSNFCCKVCGNKKKLEVHHLLPFHLCPEKELDPTNLITLCESRKSVNCHLLFGHGLNYRDYNPDCVKDVEHFHDLIVNCQIKNGAKNANNY